MWELVLFLAADHPDPKPRHVTPAGAICQTGMRCEPLRFDDRLTCLDFVIAHGREWRAATGAAVVASCVLREDEGELIG